MDCERFRDKLGEDPDEQDPACRSFYEHRESCPDCARLYGSLHRGRAILRNLPEAQVGHDFFDKLQLRIDRWEQRRRTRAHNLAVAGRVVAGSGLAVLAMFLALDRGTRVDLSRALRGAEPGEHPQPSVSVVKPFARLLDAGETGFLPATFDVTPPADAHVTEEPPSLGVDPGTILFPREASAAPPPSRSPSMPARQAVLYASPSWTFAAQPTAIRFVSAPTWSPVIAAAR